jgi:hypothetical protein
LFQDLQIHILDNGFNFLISDTDFINFKVNVLFPDNIANGTQRILTKINDSTLLFVSEVTYNIPSDSGMLSEILSHFIKC